MKTNTWTRIVLSLALATLLVWAPACSEKPATPATGSKSLAPDTSAKPAPAPAPDTSAKPAPAPDTSAVPVVAPASAEEAMKKLAARIKVPAVAVPKLAKAPEIDGVMDAAYSKATPVTLKFITGGDTKPAAATTAWVVSTDKELFFFVKCETPDMNDLMANVRDHDGQVWDDDCVELFIDPTNERGMDGYMHLMINSLGTTAEAKGPAGSEDFSWDPKLRVKTAKDKKAWTVELAIPFADMVANPAKINKAWAVNINRMAYLLEGAEDTAWSPTETTSSHVPDKFGLLWLEAGTVENVK